MLNTSLTFCVRIAFAFLISYRLIIAYTISIITMAFSENTEDSRSNPKEQNACGPSDTLREAFSETVVASFYRELELNGIIDAGYGFDKILTEPFPAFVNQPSENADRHCARHCSHNVCTRIRRLNRKVGRPEFTCWCCEAGVNVGFQQDRPKLTLAPIPRFTEELLSEALNVSSSIDQCADIIIHALDVANFYSELQCDPRPLIPSVSVELSCFVWAAFYDTLERYFSETFPGQSRVETPAQIKSEIKGCLYIALYELMCKRFPEEIPSTWNLSVVLSPDAGRALSFFSKAGNDIWNEWENSMHILVSLLVWRYTKLAKSKWV